MTPNHALARHSREGGNPGRLALDLGNVAPAFAGKTGEGDAWEIRRPGPLADASGLGSEPKIPDRLRGIEPWLWYEHPGPLAEQAGVRTFESHTVAFDSLWEPVLTPQPLLG